MSIESLKRVLLKIKGEARKMRGQNLKDRLNRSPGLVDESHLSEGSAAEEAGESPEEEAAEKDSEAMKSDSEEPGDDELKAIRKLLARA